MVYGTAVYAYVGSTINGIKMRNSTAAAGTDVTTARFGLSDNAGKILVVSANLKTASSWPQGVMTFPFTAPFPLAYTGVYFPCFVVNGTWGTTQPTPLEVAGNAGALNADGSNPAPSFTWGSQSDLPAVGSSVTFSSNGRNYWLALY